MNSIKILLIVPPNNLDEQYGKFKHAIVIYPSMGLASIAAIAEQEKHQVKIIDCEAMGYSYDDLKQKIINYKPDLIGMQTFCNTVNRALETAKIAKSLDQNIKIVLGGVQVTLFPKKYVSNQHVDFVVKGEGEIVFKNLLNCLKNKKNDFSSVNGLVWKKEKQIIDNPAEKLITNLDSLPYPALHLFDLSKYYPTIYIRGKHVLPIITSRGCPFRCGFCSCHKTFGQSYRFFGARRIVDEIKSLVKKYKIDALHFYDDNLTVNRARVMELCDLMISEKINLPWAGFARVDGVDEELLNKMKKAGCYQIFYGVETASQRLLDLMNKDITLKQIKEAFRITNKVGIESMASMMIGLPTETKKEALQSLDLAIEINASYAHWKIYTPHPGTDLFNTALKHGKLLTNDLNKYAIWTDEPVYLPNGRTVEELKKTKEWLHRKYYFRPSFIIKRLFQLLHLPPSRLLKSIKMGINLVLDKS